MRALLFGLALASCTRIDLVQAPDDGSVVASVVAWVGRDGDVHAEAFEGRSYHVLVPGDEEMVAILHYDVPLETYQLQPGPIASAVEGRMLPFERGFASRNGGNFEALEDLPPELAAFLIARFDPEYCYQNGRCLLDTGLCGECREPTLDVPFSPIAPLLPQPTQFLCPSGWVNDPVARCAPNDPPSLACGPGQAQLFGATTCAPIGALCPGGDGFPDNVPPGLAVFVRPGATGGDGSRAAPLGSIEEALAIAPAGTTIALAIGVHESGAIELTDELALFGACMDTIVRAPEIRMRGEGAGLRNLTVATDDLAVLEGEAELVDVMFAGSAATSIWIGPTGRALIDRAVFRSGAFSVEVDGLLQANELIADEADCVGAIVTNELSLQRSVFRAPVCPAIGASLLLAHGRAALDSVRLRGPVVGTSESRLTAYDLALRGGGIEFDGGTLELNSVAVEESPTAGVRSVGGTLSLTSAFLAGNAGGIELVGATTSSLSEVFIASPPPAVGLSATAGAQVIARDLAIDGGSKGAAIFGSTLYLNRGEVRNATVAFELSGSSVGMADVEIERVGTGILVDEGREVIAERLRVRHAKRAMLFGLDPSPLAEEHCALGPPTVHLLRLADVSISAAGLSVEAAADLAALDRTEIERVENGPVFCAPMMLTVSNVALSQVGRRAFRALRAAQVRVNGIAASKVGVGLVFDQADNIVISDARVAEVTSGGLSIDGLNLGGTAQLNRIEIESVTGGALVLKDLSGDLKEIAVRSASQGPCVAVTGAATLTVDKFRLAGCEPEGFRLIRTQAAISHGLVEQVEYGVGTDAPETVSLSEVVFRDVAEAVHVMPE